MRLLLVDDCIPTPSLGYGYPRAATILQRLPKAGFDVEFLALRLVNNSLANASCYPDVRFIEPHDSGIGLLSKVLSERGSRYDAVWVSRLGNLRAYREALRNGQDRKTLIYDAEALASPRELLRRSITGIETARCEAEQLAEDEMTAIRGADVVVAVSEPEARYLRNHGVERVFLLGHTMPAEPTRRSHQARDGLLFVGSFLNLNSFSPNADAIMSFVSDVMPELRRSLDAHLHIVGYDSDRLVLPGPGSATFVTLHGARHDLRDFYDRCRVFVCPTRWAGGIPWKVHEAMAHGVPVVTSALVAEQLQLDARTVLVARTPQEFIHEIRRCYSDARLWNELRAAGLDYVRTHCDDTQFVKTLIALRQCVEDSNS